MLIVLIFSVVGILSTGLCHRTGQVAKDHPFPSPRKLQTLNRCTRHVQSHFEVPPLLRYNYNSTKKLQYLTTVFGDPLFEFSLITNDPNCLNDTFDVTVSLVSEDNPTGNLGENVMLYFGADGSVTYLLIIGITEREILFDRNNYCIDRITEDSIKLNFCKSKCYLHDNEYGGNFCVPRCCALGAISFGHGENLDVNDNCANNLGLDWTPEIYSSGSSQPLVHPQVIVNDQPKEWNCTDQLYENTFWDKSSIRILPNGEVWTRKPGMDEWENAFSGNTPYKFCVDGYWDRSKFAIYSTDEPRILLRLCPSEPSEEMQNRNLLLEASYRRTKIQIFAVHIPCALIYLTVLIIYGLIWKYHYVHGWTVIGFTVSQFLNYVLLITFLSIFVFQDDKGLHAMLSNGVCVILGSLRHFFSIGTYSWTMILSFDVWTTLSSIRPESSRSKGKRLMCYTGFAVGFPTLVVFTALMIEFFPPKGNVTTPGYQRTCIVTTGIPYMLYIGLLHILLYTANLVFAGLTFRTLWSAKQNAKKLTKSNNKSTFGNKAVLVTKLLLVMGFSLIFEFILNFGHLTTYSQNFAILEGYRLLQAVGLFWTFVFSVKTQQHLQEKFPTAYKKLFMCRNGSADVSRMTSDTKMH